MKKLIYIYLVATTMLVSCSDDDDQATIDPKVNTVQLSTNASLGSILTDSEGKTLYFFSKDSKDTSVCEGECEANWPVFYEEELTLDTGLDTTDFSTITRSDGSKQTVYQGWPLYYFVNDTNSGDTNGDKVGDVWYVAKPDYSLMYASAQLVGHDNKNYLNDYTEGNGDSNYIVDIEGRTLYTFIIDTKNKNNFTTEDFSNDAIWPIAEISIDKIPSNLNNNDFGTIDVFGKTQLTYKGWPLYYFGQDVNRGDNKGISFPSPGIWPIANTDLAEAEEAKQVSLATHDALGSILVDATGKTLYFFSNDTRDTSVCEDGCVTNWPLFYEENLTLGTGLESADFAEITRADGEKQTTYKGLAIILLCK